MYRFHQLISASNIAAHSFQWSFLGHGVFLVAILQATAPRSALFWSGVTSTFTSTLTHDCIPPTYQDQKSLNYFSWKSRTGIIFRSEHCGTRRQSLWGKRGRSWCTYSTWAGTKTGCSCELANRERVPTQQLYSERFLVRSRAKSSTEGSSLLLIGKSWIMRRGATVSHQGKTDTHQNVTFHSKQEALSHGGAAWKQNSVCI